MKYKIKELHFARASKGWILNIGITFPTQQQFTWEHHRFENADTELKPSQSIIVTFIKFWWWLRSKEIRLRQVIPGEFDLI